MFPYHFEPIKIPLGYIIQSIYRGYIARVICAYKVSRMNNAEYQDPRGSSKPDPKLMQESDLHNDQNLIYSEHNQVR